MPESEILQDNSVLLTADDSRVTFSDKVFNKNVLTFKATFPDVGVYTIKTTDVLNNIVATKKVTVDYLTKPTALGVTPNSLTLRLVDDAAGKLIGVQTNPINSDAINYLSIATLEAVYSKYVSIEKANPHIVNNAAIFKVTPKAEGTVPIAFSVPDFQRESGVLISQTCLVTVKPQTTATTSLSLTGPDTLTRTTSGEFTLTGQPVDTTGIEEENITLELGE